MATAKDNRRLFDPARERVEPMSRPMPVPLPCRPELTDDDVTLLREGVGRISQDHRWLVHLDAEDVLHLYRSWTGYEIYRATVFCDGTTHRIDDLVVETAPERYRSAEGSQEESRRVLNTLAIVLQLAMDWRAGWGDYPPFPEGSPPSASTRRSWW